MDRFGGLSAKQVVNADPGQVPFAATFDAGGHLVVSEAANAVATFTLNNDGTLTLVDREADRAGRHVLDRAQRIGLLRLQRR